MTVINSKDTLSIIKRALNHADPRLVDHGARVAYIMGKLLLAQNKFDKTQMFNFYLLALLHDIGAYKTDIIDKSFTFDGKNVWDHSVYGYLFLKSLSPLTEYADIVKYHHLSFEKYTGGDSLCREIALMLNLSDFIDCCFIVNKSEDQILSSLEKLSGIRFAPEHVELFLTENENLHIIENLSDNSYTIDLPLNLQDDLDDELILSILRMLSLSIDFHSEFTVLHTISVVNLSRHIATLLDYSGIDEERVKVGALLHDIGKIGIPVEILEKDTYLTNEEMRIMRTHITLTEEIIEDFVEPEIFKIAVRHHERLDGSGYPNSLCEDDLSFSEQLMAVADTISAMYAPRSYKPPLPKKVIISELTIARDKGRLSAPIVNCCIEHFDELDVTLKESYDTTSEMYKAIRKEHEITVALFTQGKFFEKLD